MTQQAARSQRFLADLHIHSRFSRATSQDLSIPMLLGWAQRKGLRLVGTGDFTHPGWFEEIKKNLEEDGCGFLVSKPDVGRDVRQGLPEILRGDVRFILQVEVSSIFQKAGRVRKVHTLVFVSSLAAAEHFATALGRLGNISSDGRPIVGLEPLRILDLAKDADPDSFVVPAHVWTPHFSLFGAHSGFDSVEECFEGRSYDITALETGLSSDILMNRRWSALDRFALISCSDAHSPSRLGREATIFNCDLTYRGLRDALRGAGGLAGTIEFFPEEGKYHLDGHRKCGVWALPSQTRSWGGRCPVCGGSLTLGVLGRVEALSDREAPADGFPPQMCLIPLEEVLAEIEGLGTSSRRVHELYGRTLARFGPELELLGFGDLEPIEESDPLLAEALRRMREGRVRVRAGYDGEYGRVTVFEPGEIESLRGQLTLLHPVLTPIEGRLPSVGVAMQADLFVPPQSRDAEVIRPSGLTKEQAQAVEWEGGPVLVVAGPGTGKTRTLVARAERVLQGSKGGLLVITFTNRAADEVRSRLGDWAPRVRVSTFHAFALAEWNRWRVAHGMPPVEVVDRGQERTSQDTCDLDDLVPGLLGALRNDPDLVESLRRQYPHILVDEFQDISPDQYDLLRILSPDGSGLFAVGDPDQTLYAFRGSDPRAFERFVADWPGTRVFSLTSTFRLGPQVCVVVRKVAPKMGSGRNLVSAGLESTHVRIYAARSPLDEALFVSKEVRRLVGGLDMTCATSDANGLAFGQIAVLGRTHQAVEVVARVLEADGVPIERASDRPLWETPWARSAMEALRRAGPGKDPCEIVTRAVSEEGLRPSLREWTAFLGLITGLDAASAYTRLCTLREIDAWGLDAQRLACLTIHAAKGLEFDAVFVVGCEDGVLPLLLPGRTADLDEERRILFVAMTRARRLLTLSYPLSGGGGSGRPSRFLDDLAPGDCERLASIPRQRRIVQMSLFGDD